MDHIFKQIQAWVAEGLNHPDLLQEMLPIMATLDHHAAEGLKLAEQIREYEIVIDVEEDTRVTQRFERPRG